MSTSRIEALDAIVLFADLQEGIADLPLTISTGRLKDGVLNLAKLAKLFEIPAIVTAVQKGAGDPKVFEEIEKEMGNVPTHLCTLVAGIPTVAAGRASC